ncbi:hypothetical protein Tco_0614929 [Tanacetum coccineum]
MNKIGELRTISSHVLGASRVQIPQNNLDNLRLTEEEDGAIEVLDPRDIVTASRYVVPTGRVKIPAGRYVVPTGKDNVIVNVVSIKGFLLVAFFLLLVVIVKPEYV